MLDWLRGGDGDGRACGVTLCAATPCTAPVRPSSLLFSRVDTDRAVLSWGGRTLIYVNRLAGGWWEFYVGNRPFVALSLKSARARIELAALYLDAFRPFWGLWPTTEAGEP